MICEEVYQNIWMGKIPLPNNPLKALHVYLIKGERNLLIDTGFQTEASYQALKKFLQNANVCMDQTDIFLTHAHVDHTGLAADFFTGKNKIYISERDKVVLEEIIEGVQLKNLKKLYQNVGYPPGEEFDITKHPAFQFKPNQKLPLTPVKEGVTFSVGSYTFVGVDLSGHTPGQMGLFGEKEGILFGGDHILNKITPNISLWDFEEDYLQLFFNHLEKVKKMKVKILFSSHRDQVMEIEKRIDEILQHHRTRLENILNIIHQKPSTVYEISKRLPWDFAGGDFQNFPPVQKWFAISEVFAHVEHLFRKRKIQIDKTKKDWVYYKE